jgi:hydroxypyruvate reductase
MRILRDLFAHVMREIEVGRALARLAPRIDAIVRGGDGLVESPIHLIAVGKAAVPMTEWFLNAYGSAVVDGVLCAPASTSRMHPRIRCFSGGHPVPNAESLRAGSAALEVARAAGERDLVVFLVSGGGSALLEAPVLPTISLDDVQHVNETLVSCGADIVEVNEVRKRLSAVKGGRLARAAHPARQLTLYVSDVPRGRDASVASGPTMPNDSAPGALETVMSRYDLGRRLPERVLFAMDAAASRNAPGKSDPCFDRSEWLCVLENAHALDAAASFARARGWRAAVDTSVDDADVGSAAGDLLERLSKMDEEEGGAPSCLVSGGELSSPVRGAGVGGRNQAFVLECVPRIAGRPVAVLSAGTDGVDGNSPAAGAVADGTTADRAGALDMDPADYLLRSDSYSFFKRLGDDVTCGPTGNNVRDIRVLVARS